MPPLAIRVKNVERNAALRRSGRPGSRERRQTGYFVPAAIFANVSLMLATKGDRGSSWRDFCRVFSGCVRLAVGQCAEKGKADAAGWITELPATPARGVCATPPQPLATCTPAICARCRGYSPPNTRMTAKPAHVVDVAKKNPALFIPVKVGQQAPRPPSCVTLLKWDGLPIGDAPRSQCLKD